MALKKIPAMLSMKPGRLPAPDHHQLYRSRRGSDQRSELQHSRRRGLRLCHGDAVSSCHRAHGWYPGKNRGQRYSGVLQGYAHRASDSLPDGHCISAFQGLNRKGEEMSGIIIATALVGETGLLLGLFLRVFRPVFHVEVDEKKAAVREALPEITAAAAVSQAVTAPVLVLSLPGSSVNACPVGGDAAAARSRRSWEKRWKKTKRMTAFVRLRVPAEVKTKLRLLRSQRLRDAGLCSLRRRRGLSRWLLGRWKLREGLCFRAIQVIDGVAVVDREKCRGCGQCALHCRSISSRCSL